MPIEFKQLQQPAGSSDKNLFKLTMSYDGSGRKISKTRWVKNAGSQDWEKELVTHYTGIGTEIRENFTGSRFARRTQRTACKSIAEPKNLGAKRNEHDDEISLDYFGARYLDPMLGMWTSVDPKRQFASPYLYAGNGMNPVNVVDPDGNLDIITTKFGKRNEIIVTGRLHLTDKYPYVYFIDPNGKLKKFAAPPQNSYFHTENIIDQKFDPDMEQNVRNLFPEPISGWINFEIMDIISNAYSYFFQKGKVEDLSSAVMQKWGGENYQPQIISTLYF